MEIKQLEEDFLEIKNAITTILHLSDDHNYRIRDNSENRLHQLYLYSEKGSHIDIVFDKISKEIRIISYIRTNYDANFVSDLYSKKCVKAKKSGMRNNRDNWDEYNIFRRNHIFKVSKKNIDRTMTIFQIFTTLHLR